MPGTLALASYHGLKLSGKLPPKNANNEESVFEENLLLTLAEELAYTCYLTFEKQPTFLAPEITHFNSEPSSTNDFYVKPAVSWIFFTSRIKKYVIQLTITIWHTIEWNKSQVWNNFRLTKWTTE